MAGLFGQATTLFKYDVSGLPNPATVARVSGRGRARR